MSISLLDQLARLPLAFVDVETTGSSAAYGDRVTEVAVARVEGGIVTDRFAALVNPCRRIAPGVVALTGITPAMVADAPPPFRSVASDVADRLRGTVVVGHNVGFDVAFLRHEFRLAAMSIDDVADLRVTLDTVRLARKLFGRGGNGLQRLAARLEVVVDVAHRALADCLTTAAVFDRMLEPLGGGRLSLADVLMLQGGPLKLADAQPALAPLPVDLADALDARREVRMVYLDARNNRTERVVVPLNLTRVGDDRSLTAFCTLRREQRSFKLSRIVELTRIDLATDVEVGVEIVAADAHATRGIATEPLQSSGDPFPAEPYPERSAKDEPVRPPTRHEPSRQSCRPGPPGAEVDPHAVADRPTRDDPRHVPQPPARPGV